MFFFSTQSRFYLGDVGNGAAMKLVVNMIMGRYCLLLLPLFYFLFVHVLITKLTIFLMFYSMMASFSEGLLLSEKVGLDPKVLVEVFISQMP